MQRYIDIITKNTNNTKKLEISELIKTSHGICKAKKTYYYKVKCIRYVDPLFQKHMKPLTIRPRHVRILNHTDKQRKCCVISSFNLLHNNFLINVSFRHTLDFEFFQPTYV